MGIERYVMAGVSMVAVLGGCARPRAPGGGDSSTGTVAVSHGGWSRAQRDSALTVLGRQRAAWVSGRPPAYRYVVGGTCFCLASGSPQIVTVRGGRAAAQPDTGAGAGGKGAAGTPPFGTDGIDALFDSLAVAVRDTAIQAVLIDYDPRWGFPQRVTLDRIRMAIDDEYHISVSGFEPLP